jgi:hypothetical protein
MSSDDISITRSNRHSISIQVLPGGKVRVKAPYYVPEFMVRRYIKQKWEWIDKQIQKQKHIASEVRRTYTEGELYYYLGKPYALTFANVSEISFQEGHLLYPRTLVFRIQTEVGNWYIREAKRIITTCLHEQSARMNVSYTSVRFSDTSSKWGSCSPDDRLQFNWRLVMAPMLVIRYVVVHELAHTKEKNHGTAFWKLVASVTPSYKQQRKWLKEQGDMLVV